MKFCETCGGVVQKMVYAEPNPVDLEDIIFTNYIQHAVVTDCQMEQYEPGNARFYKVDKEWSEK